MVSLKPGMEGYGSGELSDITFSSPDSSTSILLYIIIGMLAVILIGIFTIIFISMKRKKADDMLGINDIRCNEQITVFAEVVNKADSNGTNAPFDSISFQFENGERREFLVSDKNFYNLVIVGDKGLLTFAGKALIKFKRM